jgi:hypothetical protein
VTTECVDDRVRAVAGRLEAAFAAKLVDARDTQAEQFGNSVCVEP